MVNNLSSTPSVISEIMHDLRNIRTQTERARFRRNLARFGTFAGYEISKRLNYKKVNIDTVLGNLDIDQIADEIVVLGILRAGLPLQDGLLQVFENAEAAFVSAYRREKPDGSFDISMDYVTCPNMKDKILIITDPMLATGRSLEAAVRMIHEYGKPREIHLVSVIASENGIDHVQHLFPFIEIWVGDIDSELTAKSYIVPGLGDAGDLAFGEKLQG